MKITTLLLLTLMMTVPAVSQTPLLGGELSNSAATSVADILGADGTRGGHV